MAPDGTNLNYGAVDETAIQLGDERYWLYSAVDSYTKRLLHTKLYPARNQATTEMFLVELRDKLLVDDVVILVDSAPWLRELYRHGLGYGYENTVLGTALSLSFKESISKPASSQTVSGTTNQILSKIGCKSSPSYVTL